MDSTAAYRWRGPEWLIAIGGALFIFILALWACFEADTPDPGRATSSMFRRTGTVI